MSRIGKSETESRLWLQGLKRMGEWSLTANGYTVSFPGDENSLKSDSGVGCTTLWICLKILNYTLEKGEFYGVRVTPQ